MTSTEKRYALLLFMSAASALRARTALAVPAWPPWGSPHLPTGQDSIPALWDHQPLPWGCHSDATARTFSSSPQPCPAYPWSLPSRAPPKASPYPGRCPIPRAGAILDAPCSSLGWCDQPWLPGPVWYYPHLLSHGNVRPSLCPGMEEELQE